MIEMNNMNKKFSSSLLVILMAALLFSCNKDISEIGVDVVGGDPLQVVYMDTVTIKVHSELIDSLRSDELSAHVLGAYKDPVFGTLNASVYSQVRLSAGYEDYDFGENPTLDSIVLYIKYSETEVYGDTLFTQNLKIYEVGEDMYRDSVYFSFTNLRIKYDLLGESSFIPSFDSIEYYENDFQDTLTKLKPITIHLTEEFGQRLLELDSATYSSNDEFLKEFKGLYITTNDEDLPSVGGGLIAASFEDDETYINLYYHNDDNDSLEFKYVTNFSTAHFSNFNHYEYLDADPIFYQQVVEGNDSLGAEMFYLQGLAGVRATIEFPYLKQMDDYYNYAINEAKLFIY
ncbi:MAG: DUF4270 family protein, partial [Bacteroidales bacterium]|nr:DUF4270 family protein [Bacteroidales bacterium]